MEEELIEQEEQQEETPDPAVTMSVFQSALGSFKEEMAEILRNTVAQRQSPEEEFLTQDEIWQRERESIKQEAMREFSQAMGQQMAPFMLQQTLGEAAGSAYAKGVDPQVILQNPAIAEAIKKAHAADKRGSRAPVSEGSYQVDGMTVTGDDAREMRLREEAFSRIPGFSKDKIVKALRGTN